MTNKKTNPKQITVNLDEESFDTVAKVAKEEDRSLSNVARRMITDSIRKQTKFQDEMVTKEGS